MFMYTPPPHLDQLQGWLFTQERRGPTTAPATLFFVSSPASDCGSYIVSSHA